MYKKKVNVESVFALIFSALYIVMFFNYSQLFNRVVTFNALYCGDTAFDFVKVLFKETAESAMLSPINLSIVVLAAGVSILIIFLSNLYPLRKTTIVDKVIGNVALVLNIAMFALMFYLNLVNKDLNVEKTIFQGNYGSIILAGLSLVASLSLLFSKIERRFV